MTLDPLVKAQLFTEWVNVKVPTSYNSTQGITFGAVATYRARVERINEVMRSAAGDEIGLSYRISTEEEIAENALVWVPPDSLPAASTASLDSNKALPVRSVSYAYGMGMLDHWETGL